MKKLMLVFATLMVFSAFTACDDDDPATEIIDTSMPQGTFTAQRSGSFVAQNNTPTMGDAELGTDEDGTTFLRFTPSFNTELATGTVTVYFSTSENLMFDAGNGNPDVRLVGPISGSGEQFFRLTSTIPGQFTHVILWCGSVGIPFGNAALN